MPPPDLRDPSANGRPADVPRDSYAADVLAAALEMLGWVGLAVATTALLAMPVTVTLFGFIGGVQVALASLLLPFALLLAAIALIRGAARLRVKQVPPGRCPGCGYDLRGLPRLGRCPECGALT